MTLASLAVTLAWIGAGAAVSIGLVNFALNSFLRPLEE